MCVAVAQPRRGPRDCQSEAFDFAPRPIANLTDWPSRTRASPESAANRTLGRVEPGQTRACSSSLAPEGATSPRQAAAAAPAEANAAASAAAAAAKAAAAKANAAASAAAEANAAASNAAEASAAAASAAVSAAAASNSDLYARLGVSGVFFVVEIERRQADVGDFLLVETGDLKRRRTLP